MALQAAGSRAEITGMFGPSDRTRRKAADAATGLLEPGTTIRTVGFGRAHGRLSTTSIVVLAVFGTIFVVALALGALIVPGGVLLIVFSQQTWPLRVVVVADQGVALLDRSLWTGKPTKVLARVSHDALLAPDRNGRRRRIGPDAVTFTKGELARVQAAVPEFQPAG
jgi:hypothetical protein